MLSENLEMFLPEYKNSFMCPTCMCIIPTANLNEISEAHIVPKAAGGKLKTFLCTKCNNKFGTKQDKWFGEIIKIANDENASILSSGIRDGYFMIDGIKVNGHWKQDQDGSLSFYMYINRNSPEINQMINRKFGAKPPKIRMEVPLPLLRNEQLIEVGYLTSAYLMWFGLMGYSWALQSHLDSVRQQILNPEKEVIDSKYLFMVKPANWAPWIGLISLFDEVVPAFGLKKHLVVLPPRDRPNYYDSLKRSQTNVNLSDIKPLKLPDKPFYGPPVFILYEDRLIVCSDTSKDALNNAQVVLFTRESNEGKILRPLDEKEFDELKKMNNAKCISIDLTKERMSSRPLTRDKQ